MRKFFFTMALLGSFGFHVNLGFSQESVDPGAVPNKDSRNPYGGVCCASNSSCQHPVFGLIADSTWTPGVIFCP